MGRTLSYGHLFQYQYDYSGEWIQDLIRRISSLSCEFEEPSSNLLNGINVSLRKGIMDNNLLGKEISQFMVCSYMIKNKLKKCKDGAKLTYLSPVNLVLDTVNVHYTSIVNKEVIESIITILNHPHFKGCHSIGDIQKKIASVDNLNERFGESESSDEDECEGDDLFIEKKNIFLD
tara:strand:- start:235 stop:762 length:528 start_codon:yes stop_codon:yes gene_type:complete